MAIHDVYFRNGVTGIKVKYTNLRSFQYTRSTGKNGKAIFSLDLSPKSQQLRAGWLVEIFRENKLVYFGKITKRQAKGNKYKLFCSDANGVLEKLKLTQLATGNREASAEIANHVDGLEVFKGYYLSASDFVDVTGTTSNWHSEDNSYADYINEISEKLENLSGSPSLFFFWINPSLDFIYNEEGQNGYHDDLIFSNITMTEDIEDTYNNITVKGTPLQFIPEDKDAWTEISTDMWHVPSGMASNPMSIDDTVSGIPVGEKTLKYEVDTSCTGLCLSPSVTFTKSILNNSSSKNMESIKRIYFHWRATTGGIPVAIYLNSDAGSTTVLLTTTTEVADTWYTIDYDLSNETYTYGTYFSIKFGYVDGGWTPFDIYLDGLYLEFDLITNTSPDYDSIDNYGKLDKVYQDRAIETISECVILSDTLLEHYKDPKTVFNVSLQDYIDIIPNSMTKLTFENTDYIKNIISITYYVNFDGSESSQLTLGDFKKNDIDVIHEKLTEINRNYNLLVNPYQTI